MAEWRDGRMAEWWNGGMEYTTYLIYPAIFMVHNNNANNDANDADNNANNIDGF